MVATKYEKCTQGTLLQIFSNSGSLSTLNERNKASWNTENANNLKENTTKGHSDQSLKAKKNIIKFWILSPSIFKAK